MSDEWRIIWRIVGVLALLIWLGVVSRKIYYHSSREASFIRLYIILAIAIRLMAWWFDVQLWEGQLVAATVFNNLIFLVPIVFYWRLGSKDREEFLSSAGADLHRRAEEAIAASTQRLDGCPN
jgi:hypothetical protein